MSSRTRRRVSAQKKAQIVRRHMGDNVAVSDLADVVGVRPSQIHAGVKQVLDQAEKALAPPARTRGARGAAAADRTGQVKDARINRLEEKLATRNQVIAELIEANVHLKQVNGEL